MKLEVFERKKERRMLIGLMQSNGGFKFSKINISRLALSISLAISIFGLLVHARDDPTDSNNDILIDKSKSSQFSSNKNTIIDENKELKQIEFQTSSHRNKLKLRRFIKKQLRHNPSTSEPGHNQNSESTAKTSNNQLYSINNGKFMKLKILKII